MLEIVAITESNYGLNMEAFISTLVYTFVGIFIMIIAIGFINMVFRLDLKHELKKDHNISYGIAIAGFAIAVALIIAGTISS